MESGGYEGKVVFFLRPNFFSSTAAHRMFQRFSSMITKETANVYGLHTRGKKIELNVHDRP